eukprot:gene8735-33597_t
MSAASKHKTKSELVDFQISESEAEARFGHFQTKECKGLNATNLLERSKDTGSCTPTYVPYWAFDVKISSQYRLGSPSAAGATASTPAPSAATESEWHMLNDEEILGPDTCPALLLFVTDGVNRSEVAAAARTIEVEEARGSRTSTLLTLLLGDAVSPHWVQPPSALQTALPLSVSEATQEEAAMSAANTLQNGLSSKNATVQQADMKQESCVALWPGSLAWRGGALMKKTGDVRRAVSGTTNIAEAKTLLGASADDPGKDVYVRIKVLERKAKLLYLPMHILKYKFGTRYKQGTSGVILPHEFYAAVGGLKTGTVTGSLHFSPLKAQLGAGAIVGGASIMFTEHALPLFGISSPMPLAGAVEAGTLALLAAAYAGMLARGWEQAEMNKATVKQSVTVATDADGNLAVAGAAIHEYADTS